MSRHDIGLGELFTVIRTMFLACRQWITISLLGVTLLTLAPGHLVSSLALNLNLIGLLKPTQDEVALREELRESCQSSPKPINPRIAWRAGWLALEQAKDPDLAVCIWRRIPDFAAQALSGAVAGSLGLPESLRYGQIAMRIAPDTFAARWALGRALFHLQRWREASDALTKALERNPGDLKRDEPEAYALAGVAIWKSGGSPDLAQAYLEQSFALEPRDDFTVLYLLFTYIDFGPQSKVEPLTRYALIHWPDNADFNIVMGDIYVAKGDYVSAEHHYQVALKARPDLALAHLKMGDVYRRAGNILLALEQYDYALQHNSDAWVYGQLADRFLQAGDRDKAIVALCHAVKLNWKVGLSNQELIGMQSSCGK